MVLPKHLDYSQQQFMNISGDIAHYLRVELTKSTLTVSLGSHHEQVL